MDGCVLRLNIIGVGDNWAALKAIRFENGSRCIVHVRSDRNAIPIQQLHELSWNKIEMAMKQMAKNADGTDL